MTMKLNELLKKFTSDILNIVNVELDDWLLNAKKFNYILNLKHELLGVTFEMNYKPYIKVNTALNVVVVSDDDGEFVAGKLDRAVIDKIHEFAKEWVSADLEINGNEIVVDTVLPFNDSHGEMVTAVNEVVDELNNADEDYIVYLLGGLSSYCYIISSYRNHSGCMFKICNKPAIYVDTVTNLVVGIGLNTTVYGKLNDTAIETMNTLSRAWSNADLGEIIYGDDDSNYDVNNTFCS